MIYKLTDLFLNATLYSLEVYKTNLSDINSVCNALWRIKGKYPYVSFFMGISETEHKPAYRRIIYTGKRGSPKTVIEGKFVPKHLHIGAIGNEEYSANQFMVTLKRSVNRRLGGKYCKITSKGNNVHAGNYILIPMVNASHLNRAEISISRNLH